MSNEAVAKPNFLPRTISLDGGTFLFGGQNVSLLMNAGLCVLVGPNGAGKSETLRRIRNQLRAANRPPANRRVVYLAAGRNSALEQFRSITGAGGPQQLNTAPAAIGHRTWRNSWWQLEGNMGMLMRLKDRPDLLLKIQARLQALYQRRLSLDWSQEGLIVGFNSTLGRESYYANHEASGILELVPLLAAIYDDEIGALLIDEPEISLHPQLQAFLLQELQAVAGDPSDPRKKVIVLATHSPTMLPVRRITDIPKLVFFIDRQTPPIQIDANSGELSNSKLGGLIARLSENHKVAFFSRRVLLVEGPSDEIVVNGLALKFAHPILGANTQVVPVTGKGQFSETVKFFRLMGKDVFVLADLDALADDNQLVNVYANAAQESAARQGMGSILEIDRSIRDKFHTLLDAGFEALSSTAATHHYWKTRKQEEEELKAKRRATLVALLATSEQYLAGLLSGELLTLRKRCDALLELLANAGCAILRRGTIEDYYSEDQSRSTRGKPEAAALEVESFGVRDSQSLQQAFRDVIRAIETAAPVKKIDENALLREQLGGLLGAALQVVTVGMSDDELNSRLMSNAASEMAIFHFANRSLLKDGYPVRQVEINIASPLFERAGFPLKISEHENLTVVIDRVLASN